MAVAAVVLVVLAWTSARGEEPVPTPAAVAGPETAPEGATRGLHGWGRKSHVRVFLEYTYKEILLGLFVLGFFLAGLWQHRHDWKPLIIGLFAFAVGMLDMAMAMSDFFEIIALKGAPVYGPDLAEASILALRSFIAGLIVLLSGGLLTLILHWRNKCFREDQLSESRTEGAAQSQG